MNNEEKKAILDLRAFLDYAIAEDMSFFSILGTLGHDVRGLFNSDDDTFLPRTSGYAERANKS